MTVYFSWRNLANNCSPILYSWTYLQMEAENSSETLISTLLSTRKHIPESGSL